MITLTQPLEFYRTFLEWYCRQTHATSYLEIGCADGGLIFRLLDNCPTIRRAVGVDVLTANRAGDARTTWVAGTSDAFFEHNTDLFDVIFVDGDHSSQQVYRDVEHALNALTPNGLVLMHDTYPPDEAHTQPEACGSAWIAAELLKDRHNELESFTFPVTYGLTLVRKQELRPWLA